MAEPPPAAGAGIPPLSLLFGLGPAGLILLAGVGAWALPAAGQRQAVAGGWLWSTAILLFLAGVTRGLSFATPGPHRGQLAQMLWLFAAGCGALLVPLPIAFALLAAGYASIALFDRRAAARGQAPAHFARLRPPQMALAVLGLLLLGARVLHG